MPSFVKQAPATLWIAVLCTAAWLVTAVQSRSLSNSYYGSSLAQRWTLWGPEFSEHPLSVLSAGFMHLDAGHLVVNMVMLLFVGAEVERALGSVLYTAAYVVSLVGASSAILWMDYTTPTVGASGALFALMALLLGVYRSRGLSLRAPAFFVLANVAYTFLASHVSLWGHLGGLCTGLILLPFLFARRSAVHWLGIAVVGAATGVLLGLRAGLWG